jgi:hypothetical protein
VVDGEKVSITAEGDCSAPFATCDEAVDTAPDDDAAVNAAVADNCLEVLATCSELLDRLPPVDESDESARAVVDGCAPTFPRCADVLAQRLTPPGDDVDTDVLDTLADSCRPVIDLCAVAIQDLAAGGEVDRVVADGCRLMVPVCSAQLAAEGSGASFDADLSQRCDLFAGPCDAIVASGGEIAPDLGAVCLGILEGPDAPAVPSGPAPTQRPVTTTTTTRQTTTTFDTTTTTFFDETDTTFGTTTTEFGGDGEE